LQQKKAKRVLQQVPVIPATAGSIKRRIEVQSGPDKKQDPISRITRAKRARVWLKW
jgi:hypothetical protein